MKLYRTRTQEEYDWLMQRLEDEGYRWGVDELPTDKELNNEFIHYRDETIVILGGDLASHPYQLLYGDTWHAGSKYPDVPIIEVSELMTNPL